MPKTSISKRRALPTFKKLSDEEIKSLNTRHTNLAELAEYVSYLRSLKVGDWGSIELGKNDIQRTVKRRTSLAASSLGKKVHWRNHGAAKDSLVFEVQAAE